jgi:hypothetical protein
MVDTILLIATVRATYDQRLRPNSTISVLLNSYTIHFSTSGLAVPVYLFCNFRFLTQKIEISRRSQGHVQPPAVYAHLIHIP